MAKKKKTATKKKTVAKKRTVTQKKAVAKKKTAPQKRAVAKKKNTLRTRKTIADWKVFWFSVRFSGPTRRSPARFVFWISI